MKKSVLAWLLVMVTAGATAFCGAAGWFPAAHPVAASLDPSVEYPSTIDLGDRELGELAVAPFIVANRGGGELVIDHIFSNCSCTGMERQVGQGFERFELLRLAAGAEAHLVMRVSVRGVPPGTSMINSVGFRTNDPMQPDGSIVATVRRVSAGVYTTPKSVSFQTVLARAQVRQVLDVRDTAIPPRSVARLSSTDPDRVTARLLPIEAGTEQPDYDHGKVIGRVEVVVATQTPGLVKAAVQIHLAGEARDPDEIPVMGRVAAPMELSPSTLFLPRQSADGPIYSATCICRSTSGQTVNLDVVAIPPGIVVELVGKGDSPSRLFRVTWRPDRNDASTGSQRRLIRLKASDGDHQSFLELPVTLTK
jgi:hypothetical protein